MKDEELAECARIALKAALNAGASTADVVVVAGSSLDVGVRLGKTEKIKHSRRRQLGIRVFVGKRSAVSSSADLEEEAVRKLAADTVIHARLAQPDPCAGLPDPDLLAADQPELELYDQEADEFPPAQAVSLATAAEAAALAADRRITNSEGAEFEANSGQVLYSSSEGFSGRYSSSSFTLSVVPVAAAENQMQRDWWYSASRHINELDPAEQVGKEAALRVIRRLGARPVKTQEVPVVFEPEVAASLLGHLAAAVSGTSLQRRASFLLDRLGQRVTAQGLTVIDDGRRCRALASRPFDAEGLPTRKTTVVDQGRLTSYLLDTYCARKLGGQSTGSAFRGVGGSPAPHSSNFYLLPGKDSPADIIGSVQQGLLVTELIGMGVNLVTGDYSRGATGQWIEHGEIVYPVEQVTIAGNLSTMIDAVDAIGNDLSFRQTTSAPTVKIARMTVAGT